MEEVKQEVSVIFDGEEERDLWRIELESDEAREAPIETTQTRERDTPESGGARCQVWRRFATMGALPAFLLPAYQHIR